MAKTKISEYSSTAANNTDINGINTAENMAPSNVNNAIRELMAQLKNQQTGASGDNLVVGGTLTVSGPAIFSSSVTFSTPTPVSAGGTGISSYAAGDIIYASASTTLSKLLKTTTGNVLLSGDSPSWGKVGLATAVSGTLPVSNGGTGLATLTSKSVLVGNGTSAVSGVAPSSDDNVLMSDGTNWTSAAISTIAAFGNSLGTNGYQKLPGGLLLQWGYQSTNSTSVAVSFPISFSSVYAIVGGGESGNSSSGGFFRAASLTTSGFTWAPGSSAAKGWWLAIGTY